MGIVSDSLTSQAPRCSNNWLQRGARGVTC